MYPVITFTEPYLHSGSRDNLLGENYDVKYIDYYSNEKHVSAKTPPTFLIHATDDRGVPVENSLMFYESLRKYDIPSEMHIFKSGGHGFGLGVGNDLLAPWKQMCINWIRNLN